MRAPQKRGNWQDAYDAQMGLWRWYRTQQGRDWLGFSYRENSANLNESTRRMNRHLYEGEATRLFDCDPLFVSREMCEVIDFASQSFEPEALLESDLITPRGFLFYEKPFHIPDRFDRPITIAAVSWTRVFSMDLPEEDGEKKDRIISLGPLGPGDPSAVIAEQVLLEKHGAKPYGISITLYADSSAEGVTVSDGAPQVIPFHLTPWWFGMSFDGNEVDENGVPTGAAWWWRILQATFRLMQQQIALKHRYRPDRNARREAKKLGMPDETTVVVVRLRREKSETPADHEPEPANYSHRFIRRGHWRNQPYSSEGIVRQIWINPTIVGDEQLPLILKPRRAFEWDR
jgi:hypothetical protein